MKKIDVLAIGDTALDAIIRLKDAHVNCNLNKEGCELCVRFGDKIPYESVTLIPSAGNSPNVAISASRLGLKVGLMTNIGDDQNGKDCLYNLEKENIDTTFIKKEANKVTNFHYVLWYDTERTILVKHEVYDYEWTNTKESEDDDQPAWIYLSSLGENSLPFHRKILNYLEKHKNVKLAFQPGTFQIKFGTEQLKDIYACTEVFFSNVEEAQKILDTNDRDIKQLAEKISSLGPKIIYISDGENGSYCYQNDELYFLPVYSDSTAILERTGAGDAFSGAIVSGLVLGLSPLDAFLWGPINAKSVTGYVGSQAGLLSREKLEEHLKNAPEDYKIIKKN